MECDLDKSNTFEFFEFFLKKVTYAFYSRIIYLAFYIVNFLF